MREQPVYRIGAVPDDVLAVEAASIKESAGVESGLNGSAVAGLTEERVGLDELDSFPDPEAEPGWVLIPDDVSPEAILDLLVRLAHTHGSWSPFLVKTGDAGPVLVPFGLGWPISPSEAAERVREGGGAAGYLSYRLAMADLSRVRHDINNPLTAALAEVQLTLLDTESGTELEESLRVVETQIRRIRDLVQDLTRYRTPRP